jgi:hypothetical protein
MLWISVYLSAVPRERRAALPMVCLGCSLGDIGNASFQPSPEFCASGSSEPISLLETEFYPPSGGELGLLM